MSNEMLDRARVAFAKWEDTDDAIRTACAFAAAEVERAINAEKADHEETRLILRREVDKQCDRADKFQNMMAEKWPSSFGNLRWACGHEGPGVCECIRGHVTKAETTVKTQKALLVEFQEEVASLKDRIAKTAEAQWKANAETVKEMDALRLDYEKCVGNLARALEEIERMKNAECLSCGRNSAGQEPRIFKNLTGLAASLREDLAKFRTDPLRSGRAEPASSKRNPPACLPSASESAPDQPEMCESPECNRIIGHSHATTDCPAPMSVEDEELREVEECIDQGVAVGDDAAAALARAYRSKCAEVEAVRKERDEAIKDAVEGARRVLVNVRDRLEYLAQFDATCKELSKTKAEVEHFKRDILAVNARNLMVEAALAEAVEGPDYILQQQDDCFTANEMVFHAEKVLARIRGMVKP